MRRAATRRAPGRELLGTVLAGGASVRFGRDKTVEPVDGVPMVIRAYAVLELVFDEVAIVLGAERGGLDHRAAAVRKLLPGAALVRDAREGTGPIAGVEAALTAAEARGFDGAFVLASDLPLASARLVSTVARAWAEDRAVAVAPGFSEAADTDAPRRTWQPLCAVYSNPVLTAIRRLCARGEHSLHGLLDEVGGRPLTLDKELGRELLNVNRPSELGLANAIMAARGEKPRRLDDLRTPR